MSGGSGTSLRTLEKTAEGGVCENKTRDMVLRKGLVGQVTSTG